MARFEDWQPSEEATRGARSAMHLSQSAQMLFLSNADSGVRRELPESLDFGTGADLYLSPPYTGDSPLARSVMTENLEQKLDVAKVQKTADATADAGVISGQANQDKHGEAFKLLHAEDKNPSGIMPALHENFGISGDLEPSDLGKRQKDSDVVAARDDFSNHNLLAEKIEKKIPHDGSKPHLKEFFTDYKSPVMDAYERSKGLKDGETGKSKTLEDIVDRLKDCPWLSKLYVKYDSKASNPEYSNIESTITLRPQDTTRQIENFAHEGFHATHQFLSKLYDHGKIGPKEFENLFMNGEVESMLVEARVHRDLDPNGEPTKYYYLRADNGKVDSINILQYAQEHTRQGLLEFLRTAQPTGDKAEPYGKHYSESYKSYIENFDQNKPAVEKFIQKWVASGRKREDI